MVRPFGSQIQPWQPIVERHLKEVINASKAFVEAVLEHVMGSWKELLAGAFAPDRVMQERWRFPKQAFTKISDNQIPPKELKII